MEQFARRYCENNPDVFPDQDTAFILAFSLIMLNTDAHHPAVQNKMTKSEFIKNNRGIWAGADPPQEFLETLYDRIVENEIKFERANDLQNAAEKKVTKPHHTYIHIKHTKHTHTHTHKYTHVLIHSLNSKGKEKNMNFDC
jgi:brefeldin A-inhibited guanine nucleotide-exchange protein